MPKIFALNEIGTFFMYQQKCTFCQQRKKGWKKIESTACENVNQSDTHIGGICSISLKFCIVIQCFIYDK